MFMDSFAPHRGLWPALGTHLEAARPTQGQARCHFRAQETDRTGTIAPGRRPGREAPLLHIVGIEKSAPERMPVGQREVMVFSLV